MQNPYGSYPPEQPHYVQTDPTVYVEKNTREANSHLDQLVSAMEQSLQISEQTRADAARSERHSRIISYCSLAVAVASLAAAVAALFVAI